MAYKDLDRNPSFYSINYRSTQEIYTFWDKVPVSFEMKYTLIEFNVDMPLIKFDVSFWCVSLCMKWKKKRIKKEISFGNSLESYELYQFKCDTILIHVHLKFPI